MSAAAVRLWRANPDCYRAIYHADLDAAHLDYCRRFIDVEGRREDELRARLGEFVTRRTAETALPANTRDQLVRLLYHAHLPLKRMAFRRGMLRAVEGGGVPAAGHAVLSTVGST